MENYSANQIKRMEQEATRRAREYSNRAKPIINEQKHQENFTVRKPEINEHKEQAHTNTSNKPMKKRGSFSFLNALDIKKLIGENSEQAMLLLLVLILANDNTCDEYLLYALIYIML